MRASDLDWVGGEPSHLVGGTVRRKALHESGRGTGVVVEKDGEEWFLWYDREASRLRAEPVDRSS